MLRRLQEFLVATINGRLNYKLYLQQQHLFLIAAHSSSTAAAVGGWRWYWWLQYLLPSIPSFVRQCSGQVKRERRHPCTHSYWHVHSLTNWYNRLYINYNIIFISSPVDGSRTVIAMKTTTSVMMIAAALGRTREELLRLIDANKRGFIIKIITGSHTPNDIRTGRLIVASCRVFYRYSGFSWYSIRDNWKLYLTPLIIGNSGALFL